MVPNCLCLARIAAINFGTDLYIQHWIKYNILFTKKAPAYEASKGGQPLSSGQCEIPVVQLALLENDRKKINIYFLTLTCWIEVFFYKYTTNLENMVMLHL